MADTPNQYVDQNEPQQTGLQGSLADSTAGVDQTPGTFIVEETRVWDSPGIPNAGIPPRPGRSGPVYADITKEYVSSQPNQWYLNLVRVLEFSIDDLTAEFGTDLYQRMMYDPIVASSINTLKAAVLEDGISLRPAIADENDGNYELARHFQEEAEEMLDRYEQNLDDWLWDAADAIWRGHSVSEITYYIDTALSGKEQYFLKRLAKKPPQSFGFAVDNYKNIIGISALIPGIGMPVYSGNIVIDPSHMPNLLPREHFAIYTHRPRDEDPRGVSILRPIYTPWSLKMAILPEYGKWLRQFASPTLIGYTAQEAMQIPLVDASGNPLLGSDGNPVVGTSPEEVMNAILQKVQNGATATFPFGADVKWIEMRGMGNPFLYAFRFFDEQIATGIMGQSMTSLSQKYGTQALGGVQENTFDTTVHQIKSGIVRMIFRDILRNWIKYNFGKQFMPLTPKPYLGQIEVQDFASRLNSLVQGGYQLDPSQFPEVDQQLGMPVRAANWQEQAAEVNARKTFLEQEGWAGGSAMGQMMAESLGAAPSDTPQGGSQQQDQAAMAHQEIVDHRHRRKLLMAQELKRLTGIDIIQKIDDPPPSTDELKDIFRSP
jgi:hypothetical protein